MNAAWQSRACLVVAALLVLAMPSTESLWIDEAYTAYLARQPSLDALIQEFVTGTRSEHQMPLSMGAAWLGAQIFGTSEYALRAVNLLWGILAVLGMAWIGRRLALPWLPLFFAVHPFFWHYMDEARPYAMQIACGVGLCLTLVLYLQENARTVTWAAVLSIASVLLCGSSLLGVVPVATLTIVLAAIAFQRRWTPDRAAIGWLIGTIIVLLPLGAFYLWTLSKGAAGARYWSVSPANLALSAYELGGFSGLGPARHLLRESAAEGLRYQHLFLPFVPGLALLSVCYGALVASGSGAVRSFSARNVFWPVLWMIAATSGLILALSMAARWPFWGRHLAPLLPFVVLLVTLLLQAMAANGQRRLSAVVRWTLIALLLLSSARLRFAPYYARDDYRGAAEIARTALAEGRTVWWSGDGAGAAYYQLQLRYEPIPGTCLLVQNWSAEQIAAAAQAAPPELIVLTKPSLLDPSGALREYIAAGSWRIAETPQTFRVYRRSTP